MENLNAEQIIKALECCISLPLCDDCPRLPTNCHILEDALALINQLTEENDAWQKQLIATEEKSDKAYYDLACEVEDFRKENEKLHASCTELTRKCASLTEENERLRASSVDYRNIPDITAQVRSDTVRKMLQRIKDDAISISLLSNPPKFMLEIREDALDQIAKEMEEGVCDT